LHKTGTITSGFEGKKRKYHFLKISSWLWYAFYKPSSNLENRMTVCMGYPAMTPKWESRKTPPERGAGKPCRDNG